MCENRHSLVSHLVTIAVGAVVYGRTIKLPKPRTVGSQIPQTASEQQSPRLKHPLCRFIRASEHAKVISRNFFDSIYTSLDNQSAMTCYFVASFGQQSSGRDCVMTQEPMDAMRIFVSRTVVMKRQCSAKVARQKQRRRQSRRPATDHDAVVQVFTHLLKLARATSACCFPSARRT